MIGNHKAIREKGFQALIREFGVAGAVVFIRQYENGNGNYTLDRYKMMQDNTVDIIAERIKNRNASNLQAEAHGK